MKNFDDDKEKFCPFFCGRVSGDKIVFKNLNRRCLVIVGCEVVNSVLSLVNGSITPESSFSKNCEFTEKEQNIIRSQMALDMPLRKTNTGQKSFFFLGPKIWSKTSPYIKNARTSSSFMYAIKKNNLLHLPS